MVGLLHLFSFCKSVVTIELVTFIMFGRALTNLPCRTNSFEIIFYFNTHSLT